MEEMQKSAQRRVEEQAKRGRIAVAQTADKSYRDTNRLTS